MESLPSMDSQQTELLIKNKREVFRNEIRRKNNSEILNLKRMKYSTSDDLDEVKKEELKVLTKRSVRHLIFLIK